jgi:antitoxin ParD1/3/4
MITLNLQLPDGLAQFARAQAEAEGLAGPENYVEALLAREQRKREDIQQLDGELQQGLSSGSPAEVNDAFWEHKRHDLLKRFRH